MVFCPLMYQTILLPLSVMSLLLNTLHLLLHLHFEIIKYIVLKISDLEVSLKNCQIDDDVYNKSYEAFSHHIPNVINSYFPWKTIKIKERAAFKPWVSRERTELIKARHKLCKKFIRKPVTFGNQYRQCRNKVIRMLINAKQNYYINKHNLVTGSSKETWRVLNDLSNRNT